MNEEEMRQFEKKLGKFRPAGSPPPELRERVIDEDAAMEARLRRFAPEAPPVALRERVMKAARLAKRPSPLRWLSYAAAAAVIIAAFPVNGWIEDSTPAPHRSIRATSETRASSFAAISLPPALKQFAEREMASAAMVNFVKRKQEMEALIKL